MVERHIRIVEVVSSSLIVSTILNNETRRFVATGFSFLRFRIPGSDFRGGRRDFRWPDFSGNA